MKLVPLARMTLIAAAGLFGQNLDVGAVLAQVSEGGSVSPNGTVNYKGAQPLPLPLAPDYTDEDFTRTMLDALRGENKSTGSPPPGRSMGGSTGDSDPGHVENGFRRELGRPELEQKNKSYESFDFGSANLPFSTAKAQPDNAYPYRAAGKLFFVIDGSSYICTASLIKRGIIVTAAHCVAEFGKNRYYSGWEFVPGYRDGSAPYGAWTGAKPLALAGYLDGTDPCQTKGVVCQDDVAVLALNPQIDGSGKKSYPGDSTGWFSYGWNRSGFTPSGLVHVTQLGYPGCLDKAGLMERNDAQGALDNLRSSNTVIGSLMCGGSSGGPWLVNFGLTPGLSGTTTGQSPTANQIIGVTSWGSTNNAVKWMGASPLLDTNIVPLVEAICKSYLDACISS